MPTNLTLSGLHKELSETNSISEKLSLVYYYYLELHFKPKEKALNDFDDEAIKTREILEKKLRSDLENHINPSDCFESITKIKKEKYSDPLQKFENQTLLEKHKISNEVSSCFFGNGVAYHSFIPEDIFKLHFHDLENNIEYKYWFFNYWANLFFESMVNNKAFQNKLNSKKANIFLSAELTEIQNFENRVDELILKEHISTDKKTSAFRKEIEYIRVIDDYYKTNLWENNHDATLCKAKYILFKEYLEEKISQLESHNDNDQVLDIDENRRQINKPNIIDYLYPDKIDFFIQIENDLKYRNFIVKETNNWNKNKNDFAKNFYLLSMILISDKYFKTQVKGNKISESKIRQILSEYFGFNKSFLRTTRGNYSRENNNLTIKDAFDFFELTLKEAYKDHFNEFKKKFIS